MVKMVKKVGNPTRLMRGARTGKTHLDKAGPISDSQWQYGSKPDGWKKSKWENDGPVPEKISGIMNPLKGLIRKRKVGR